MTKRVRIVQGGTSAGKTYSILPVLISYAATHPNKLISVVSESMPHLKRGAMKDFEEIMRLTGRWVEGSFNKQDSKYTFQNGSKIEFFSADQPDRLRGARRDALFINEANNVKWDAYLQLIVRTNDFAYVDFNPVAEFWAHTELEPEDDSEMVILTYHGNEGLPKSIVKELEKQEKKKGTSDYWTNWVNVYIYGQVGKLSGAVYENWEVVKELPKDAKLLGYGLDWGYSNDPTALIAAYKHNSRVIWKEIIYETELTNADLAKKMKELGVSKYKTIWADSSEPKSIEDLRRYGFFVKPTKKGADSIMKGIDLVQSQPTMGVTSDSTNLIKEFRNYIWEKDKEGNKVNKPIDKYNHCFIGSTPIETINGTIPISDIEEGDYVITPQGAREVLLKWNNGEKQVATYSMQFGIFSLSLSCTNDHKIKTEKEGWKEISKLRKGDKVYLHKSLMEKHITSTMENAITRKVVKGCTELFGNTITEKFQKATTFITLMEILATTTSKTLISLMSLYTFAMRVRKGIKRTLNGLRSFILEELKLLKHGISQKRGENGIESTVKKSTQKESIEHLNVKSAERNTKQDTLESANTAMLIARLRHLDVEEKPNQEVFDLTVDSEHCYYANGVLVHNCMDSLRYYALMEFGKRNEFVCI